MSVLPLTASVCAFGISIRFLSHAFSFSFYQRTVAIVLFFSNINFHANFSNDPFLNICYPLESNALAKNVFLSNNSFDLTQMFNIYITSDRQEKFYLEMLIHGFSSTYFHIKFPLEFVLFKEATFCFRFFDFFMKFISK